MSIESIIMVYKCRKCNRYYCRYWQDRQVCKCGETGEHISTVNAPIIIERYLNCDKSVRRDLTEFEEK